MALKNLSTETMLALSSSWLDAQRARPTLSAHPRTAPYLADLEEAHAALLAANTSPVDQGSTSELATLSAEAAAVDQLHDRKVRGLYAFLTALSELANERLDAERYLDARNVLFPEGTSINRRTYLDEAGNAETVSQRLAGLPAVQELLNTTPLAKDRNLGHEVAAWLEAGLTLGKLETRRAELLHERDATAGGSRRGELFRARNRWGRVASAMLAALELDEQTSDAIDRNFLRPLLEAEAKADRRAASESQPHPEPPAPPAPPAA
jgi:hypothetical protein